MGEVYAAEGDYQRKYTRIVMVSMQVTTYCVE